MKVTSSLPPWGKASAEVFFRPRRQRHLAIDVFSMRKSQGERRWTTDHLAGIIVPRPVARALELFLHCIPWHNAPKVSAHCIDPVLLKRVVRCDHEVSRVTLQALC